MNELFILVYVITSKPSHFDLAGAYQDLAGKLMTAKAEPSSINFLSFLMSSNKERGKKISRRGNTKNIE